MKEAKKEKMSTQMSDLGVFWHWWQCRQNNLMAFLSMPHEGAVTPSKVLLC